MRILLQRWHPGDEMEYARHLATHAAAPVTLVDSSPLPLATAETAPSYVPESAMRELHVRGRRLASRWDRRIPLAEGEEQIESGCTFFTQRWDDIPEGTVVYRRRTSRAEYLVALDVLRVDFVTATICATGATRFHVTLAAQAPQDAYPAGEAAVDVIEGALTMLEFAAFLGGPEGIVAAGGVSVFHTIFVKYLAPQQKDLSAHASLRDIKAAVSEVVGAGFDRETLINASAQIQALYTWLQTSYNAAWEQGPHPESKTQMDEALDTLKGALDPNGNLRNLMSKLETDHYRVIGLSVYLSSVALSLTLRKIKMLLDTANNGLTFVYDSAEFGTLLAEARLFHSRAAASLAEGRRLIAERLAHIQGPLTKTVMVPVSGGRAAYAGGEIERTMHYFLDGDQELGRHTNATGGGCGSEPTQPDALNAEEFRKYRAAAEAEVRRKYNFTDEAKLAAAVDKVAATVTTYESLLPPRKDE